MPLLNAAIHLPHIKPPIGPEVLRKAVAYLAGVALVAAGLIAGAVPANAATYTFKGVVTGKLTAAAAPSALGSVWVGAYTNDPSTSYVAGAWSAADGTYNFTVPAAGSYKLWITCGSGACSDTYPAEWYNNHSSSYNSDPVTVSDSGPTATINHQLDSYGKMSGRITNTAGAAVTAVEIAAVPAEGGQGSYTTPDANGYYTLTKVPPNLTTISVRDTSGQRLYKAQHWNGAQGTETYTSATVPAGANWTNANFTLNSETLIEATITDTSGAPLAEIGYTPYEFNDATGVWDGPQMGPLLSDGGGKVYWPMTVGKKYKFCVTDNFYRGAPREYRYKAECYNNAATVDTAAVLTATAAGQRVQVAVQLDLAGLSLTAGELYAYGSAQAGQMLTVDPGVWGPAPVALTYQWQRSKESAPLDIVGATSNTYSPTASDAGHDVWAKVTGTKAGYATHSETVHAGTSGAEATTTSKPLTLVGSPTPGNTLTADFGTVTPAPQNGASYEWLLDGVADYRSYGSTFALQASDAGKKVTVRVSIRDWPRQPYYGQASVTVAAGTLTAPVPTITGTAKVGHTLTATPGVWGPAPVTLAYQWFRSGVAISGATAGTYTATSADLAKTVTVRVTGSKAGFTTAAKTSAATAAVAAGTLTAPVPTITGTAKVGQTLTATPGAWGPAPVTLAYQWFRSGVAITGATAGTYTATSADLAKTVTVRVTGSKAGFTTAAKTSAATAAVVVGTLTGPTPTITGTKTVGSVLTATSGAWGPSPVSLKYQWYRGTTAITGATAQTYTLVAADKGSALKVRVTGTKTGYTSLSRDSALTAAIG